MLKNCLLASQKITNVYGCIEHMMAQHKPWTLLGFIMDVKLQRQQQHHTGSGPSENVQATRGGLALSVR